MSFDLKIQNRDLVITNGDLVKIQDNDKLIQDILKICLTPAGSNPMQPWYGSYVSRALIGSALDTGITIQIAKSQLHTALENLKSLQELQVKSFQQVSAEEQINAVLDVSVLRRVSDPTIFDIKIKIITKSLKQINPSFSVSTL